MNTQIDSQENSAIDQLDVLDLNYYLQQLLRKKYYILGAILLSAVLSILYSMLLRPEYTSSLLMEINTDGRNLVKFQNIENAEHSSAEFVFTQAKILDGDSISEKVIETLNLKNNPEFNGGLEQRGFASFLGGIITVLKGGKSELTDEELSSFVLEKYKSKLTVIPIKGSSLISLKFESFDPELAKDILNEHANAFISLSNERKFNSSSEAYQFLQGEIKDVQDRVQSSEIELTKFARKYGIVDVEDRNNIVLERVADLNTELSQAQSQRVQAETLYKQSRKSNANNFSEVFQDRLVVSLRNELAQTRSEYYELLKIYKPKYPKMLQLKEKERELEASIQRQSNKIAASYKLNYDQLRARENLLKNELGVLKNELLDLKEKAVSYNILKREWESNKELYAGLLEKIKEVGVAAGAELNIASIVDAAKKPLYASSPKKKLNLAFACILGAFLSMALVLLREFLDRTINTVDQIEQVSSLGHLGNVTQYDKQAVVGGASTLDRPFVEKLLNTDAKYLESINSLRTSLTFSRAGGMPKSILVTSAEPGEGKTTLAASLAVSYSLLGKKVLVIDGDIRRGTISNHFGIASLPGLSDYLVSNDDEPAIHQMQKNPTLHVLVSGTNSPNVVDLLSSNKLGELIQKCESMYDLIIIDSPPVLDLADTLVLSKVVQSVLFVISAHSTKRETIKASVQQLKAIDAPLIGTVLNKYDIRHGAGGTYNYYQYLRKQGDS